MENRTRRNGSKRVHKFFFSSDDEDTNNDDSLFVLEDDRNVTLDSEEESSLKRRKVKFKTLKNKTDALIVKKTDSRPARVRKLKGTKEKFVAECNTIRNASDSKMDEVNDSRSTSTSTVSKCTKRENCGPMTALENSEAKRIKLETNEFAPDRTKIKVERVSSHWSVQSDFCDRKLNTSHIKLKKRYQSNERKNHDVKPDIGHIRNEIDSEKSDESHDLDRKPIIDHIKLEKDIKQDPDVVAARPGTSKKKTIIKKHVSRKSDVSYDLDRKPILDHIKLEKDIKHDLYAAVTRSSTAKNKNITLKPGSEISDKFKDFDRKPILDHIKLENAIKKDPDVAAARPTTSKKKTIVKKPVSEKSDKSNDLDRKPILDHIKIEKNIKHDPEAATAGPGTSKTKTISKKSTKVKTEVKKETDPSQLDEEFMDEKVFGDHKINCKLGEQNWESKMLADKSHVDFWVARNIINLLKNDCTIPFIARYRRSQTGDMDADQLRHIKDVYDYIKNLAIKAQNVKKQIQKLGKMSPQLERIINRVQSLDELDFIYAPYKQGSSKSKAEKARALGLEEAAHLILNGDNRVIVNQYLDASKEGLKNNDEIIQGIQNIVADLFSKNDAVLEYLHDLEKTVIITIKSTKKNTNEDSMGKFELYYDFQTTTSKIQPHQILALNRGESLKILTVKMLISDFLPKKLYEFCEKKWLRFGLSYTLRTQMFRNSFNDAYARLISPLLTRRAKSDLNQRAQRAAIENFAVNLKNLLQTPPIKSCSILGIDPGFRHGFKFALINGNGDVLWTYVFHFEINNKSSLKNEKALIIVREKLIAHECELIAIGNGTGCREIETIISHFISKKFFQPELNVRYAIVNERGASIYSCSTLAKEEFPTLDPNLVSAVFIARSLQDPLNEYVKVEPKHLGVGMYQHDVPENKLNSALDEIVSECVSFTGVDVNTASVHLLKRISGLGAVKATGIIDWRRQYGPFRNREQLTLVHRIGQKTFEQCSGFIRIHAQNFIDERDTATDKRKITKAGINNDVNPLDTTWIHPESYPVTYLFVDKCKVDLLSLGTPAFIDQVKKVVDEEGVEKIASDLNEDVETIRLIANALMKPEDYDYRSQFAKPYFKQGLTEIANLKIGMVLTGVVGNVANFGAFVDIGVGKNGLIHVSRMNGSSLQVGDRVEVEIIFVEAQRGRIGLNLLNIFH